MFKGAIQLGFGIVMIEKYVSLSVAHGLEKIKKNHRLFLY